MVDQFVDYKGGKDSLVVLGGGTFGKCLSHEGEALKDGISAVKKEAPESSLTPSTI